MPIKCGIFAQFQGAAIGAYWNVPIDVTWKPGKKTSCMVDFIVSIDLNAFLPDIGVLQKNNALNIRYITAVIFLLCFDLEQKFD